MEKKKLLDVCHIQYGFPFDSSHFTSCETDMPLIRIRDVKEGKTSTYYNADYPEEYIVRKGEYLIGMDGEFNIAPWNSQNALLNQRVCKVTSKTPEVSIDYVYRFLTKELKKIEDETPFVTVKHLSAKRLNQVFLPLPPLSTQQQIVSELDLLSHILDQKRQQLKEYDALAESIFYDMFGDPVENPKGWEVKKVSDLGIVKIGPFGSLLHASDYISGGIPLVNPIHMKDGHVIVDTDFTISESMAKTLSNYLLKANDIVLARRGDIGRCAVISEKEDGYICGTGSLFIRPGDLLTPVYSSFLVQTKSMKEYLISQAQGVTMLNINCKIVENLLFPLPPLTLQRSFAAKIESIEHQKQLLRASIKETEMLFQSRMDYWFNS